MDDDLAHPDSVEDPELTLVRRLSRPHPSGGMVIERAAILAAGSGSAAVFAWITSHGGKPESAVDVHGGGLHAGRDRLNAFGADTPLRYVLPAGTL